MDPLRLPLPADALPLSIRKFGDPAAPGPARAMAAKGLVPVRGEDLVTLLVQLSADSDEGIADAAKRTLEGVPENVLSTAAGAPTTHPAVLDRLADIFRSQDAVLEPIAGNHATADTTIERMARTCRDMVSEIIATNEQRMIGDPKIIEALYKNENTRMSTADRIIELAARHQLEITGIPAFHAHVEALSGQLIPERSDEPLPADAAFRKALEEDAEDPEAIDIDKADGTETLKKKYGSLRDEIGNMSNSERIRLAQIGSAAARAILVRHANKQVSFAAISSPKMNGAEATAIAHSKEISDDILRYIGNRREWLRNYEIKRALVFNPKTPVGISLRFLSHLREHDLKSLTRSRGVPGPLKSAATQRWQQKAKGRG